MLYAQVRYVNVVQVLVLKQEKSLKVKSRKLMIPAKPKAPVSLTSYAGKKPYQSEKVITVRVI